MTLSDSQDQRKWRSAAARLACGAAGLAAICAGCKAPGLKETPRLTLDTTARMAIVGVGTSAPTAVPSPTPSKDLLDAGLPQVRPVPVEAAAAPEPAPTHTTGMFILSYPVTWRQAASQEPGAMFALLNGAAGAQFTVSADPAGTQTEAAHLRDMKDLAADGLVSVKRIIVDELAGWQLVSNHHTLEGPRYVRQHVFLYRRHFLHITASWDKLAPEGADIQRDVESIIKQWRWL